MVAFFMAQMIGQFTGGATLISSITGLDHVVSLLIFGAVVIIYTSFGGFSAVAITDTIQGIVMCIGTFLFIFFVLKAGDGLSVLSAGEVGTIVLAGVSAQTTWEIIEQAPWVMQPGGPRLVLVPATRHSELRRWLWAHGFALAADRPVQAAGRWYAVMAAEYTGERKEASFTECLFGRTGEWPEGAGYAAWQKAKLPRFRLGVPDGTALAEEIDTLLESSLSQAASRPALSKGEPLA